MTAVLSLLVILCGTASAGTDSLRIMSYNLRFGELAGMQEIAEYIRTLDADIVALQECDWATSRERAPHQNGVRFINELASGTGMFGIYGKSIDYRGGYYGIGILSRYPIVRSERTLLPNAGGKEQRSMLRADIELPDGQIITFICTHLEVSSPELRMEQVRFIDRQVRGIGNHVFLAGDMNALPDSPEMAWLRKGWDDLTDRELTFSTKSPSIKIDYIYGRKKSGIRLVRTWTDRGPALSDHFPVISDVTAETTTH